MWWIVCIVIAIAFPPAIVPMGIFLGIMLLKMNSEMNSNNENNNNNYSKQQDYDINQKQGEALANFNLGCKYYFAEGVAKDYTKAFEFFKKAADQGNVSAQNNLGVIYDNGQGVSKDYNKAIEWYTKAAEQGYSRSQYNLGVMYEYGQGVSKDYKKAIEWYTKAADQGHVSAQYNMGVLYDDGKGVSQDHKKAIEWYTKAADQGYASAQNNLGVMYDNGLGVSKDYKKAIEWYTKAADQGDVSAQYNLGNMHENGIGVVKDIKKAAEWYKKAAEQGSEPAKKRLEIINKNINVASSITNKKTENNKTPFVKDSKKLDTGLNKLSNTNNKQNNNSIINYKLFYTKVAGVTIDDRQEKVKKLHKGQSLMLYREPLNLYDQNAIAVYAGNDKIGYLNKEIASDVAVLMDNGTSYYCEVSEVTGGDGYNYGVNIKLEEMALEHLYKLIKNNIDKMFYNMIRNKNDQQMIELSSDVIYRCINPYIITDSDKYYVKSTLSNQNVDSFGAMCTLALMSYFIKNNFSSEYNFMELYDNICIKISSYIKHQTFKTEFVQYTWKVQEHLGLSTAFYNGLVDYSIGRTKQINNNVINKFFLESKQTKIDSQPTIIQNNKSIQNFEDEYTENYYHTLDEDEKQDYDDWLEYVDNHN